MTISMNGFTLNQSQLQAIAPLISAMAEGIMDQESFNTASHYALAAAGCPLPTGPSVQERASRWVIGSTTGMSSITIWSHMMRFTTPETFRHDEDVDDTEEDGLDYGWPHDPSDFNRCLELLALIPEWKPRLSEMAAYGDGWALLIPIWDDIESSLIKETGHQWSNSKRAPRTYAIMKTALAPLSGH